MIGQTNRQTEITTLYIYNRHRVTHEEILKNGGIYFLLNLWFTATVTFLPHQTTI